MMMQQLRHWLVPGLLLAAGAVAASRPQQSSAAPDAPPVTAAAQAEEPSALVKQARGEFDAGKYREVLRLVSTELAKANPPGDGRSTERYELLLLKAESLLRLNQRNPASAAFEQAVRAAPDIRTAAVARATSLLTRKSQQNGYSPSGKTPPIDILATESRTKAFAALHEDMTVALKPKLAKAQAAKSLPPITEALPMLLDVASVEYASKGSAEEGKVNLASLGEHARELINADLRRISYRIDALASAADSLTSFDAGAFQGDQIGRRGLNSSERKELEETTKYLRQVEEFTRGARRRARELGFEGKAWEPLIAEAGDGAERAAALLAAPR